MNESYRRSYDEGPLEDECSTAGASGAGDLETCDAPAENAEVTGIFCDLRVGHPGDHCAYVPLTWEREER